jgi:hypothetical protein
MLESPRRDMPRRGLLARRFTARKRKHTNGKNKPTW